MDVVAHGLWAGIGIAAVRRHWPVSRRAAIATVALAVVPDLAQLLPLLAALLFRGDGVRVITAYAGALPGFDPTLPPQLRLPLHHLHCAMHSAVVAALVTVLLWLTLKSFWWPLAGWWSHIVIDVFTHSADFYPSPVLYPFTERGFDGVAWNSPLALVANYAALGAAAAWLATRRPRPSR
ncbi:MAG: hypothetical protein OEU94_17970 [Aquincola sp.]|nr:hypothetical protein [Aquincola sp.]